ncbi:MAG: hypothetical protein JXX14_03335 [Deltaproteobacteria bacterium]|nr:hypothetical protein [Deltaproteobacteria bacterium]
MADVLNWKPDEALVENVVEILSEAEMQSDESIPNVLERIGTLVYAGAKDRVVSLIQGRGEQLDSKKVNVALAHIDADHLTDASIEMSRLLIELTNADPDRRDVLCDQVVALMSVRDKVALQLAGAKEALGHSPDITVELVAAIDAFDEVLRPEQWRTVALGERRWARVAWAHPDYRSQLWWWLKGAGIPASAVESLKQAAQLINEFPEAQAELDILIQAEKTVSALTAKSTETKVTSIRDFLISKKQAAEAPDMTRIEQEQVRVAAADEDIEQLIYKNDQVEISVSNTHLYVDKVGAMDEIRALGATICVPEEADLQAETPFAGRLQFPLDAPQLSCGDGKLNVEWEGGHLELPLPLPDSP